MWKLSVNGRSIHNDSQSLITAGVHDGDLLRFNVWWDSSNCLFLIHPDIPSPFDP